MRIAESECGSSPIAFMRLKVSRPEMPASTRIRVHALATIAQLPRLPEASMETVTLISTNPCPQHTRASCGYGSYFLVKPEEASWTHALSTGMLVTHKLPCHQGRLFASLRMTKLVSRRTSGVRNAACPA